MDIDDTIRLAKPTKEEEELIAVIMGDLKTSLLNQRNTIYLELIARLQVEAMMSMTINALMQKKVPPLDVMQQYIEKRISMLTAERLIASLNKTED